MSQKRFKARMRRLKQKQQRKAQKELKAAWAAIRFKTRNLLNNIGYTNEMLVVFWMSCKHDKIGLRGMLDYLVRGHARIWSHRPPVIHVEK